MGMQNNIVFISIIAHCQAENILRRAPNRLKHNLSDCANTKLKYTL